MKYYTVNANSEIISMSDTQPTSGEFYQSETVYDLDSYTVTVGAVNNGVITFVTQQPKPAEILIKNIQTLKSQNNALGQQVTTMTISGAQKDTQMKQLGSQLVQMQLDIAKLKGGAAT